MVDEITQTSRGNSNNVIPSEARDLTQGGKFTHRKLRDQSFDCEVPPQLLATGRPIFAKEIESSSWVGMTARGLRHLCHALAIQPHLADAFNAGQDVINRLAAEAHQFAAHNARHEIAREIENLLWR